MATDRSCFRHNEKMEEEERNSRKGHPRIATPSMMEEKIDEVEKDIFENVIQAVEQNGDTPCRNGGGVIAKSNNMCMG